MGDACEGLEEHPRRPARSSPSPQPAHEVRTTPVPPSIATIRRHPRCRCPGVSGVSERPALRRRAATTGVQEGAAGARRSPPASKRLVDEADGRRGSTPPPPPVTSSVSSPTVRPGGSSRTPLQREQHAGTKASREFVSWRIVSLCPRPPRITSWCATRPGSRTEWIATSPPIFSAVALRFRRARRASCRGAARRSPPSDLLRRLGGEAHHQDRPDREVRRVEDRHAASRRELVDGSRGRSPSCRSTRERRLRHMRTTSV